MKRPSVVYRAQPRCSTCSWRGESRGGIHREPHGSLAFAEANQHRQGHGHEVTVRAGWRAKCFGCNVVSDLHERKQEAWDWVDQHTTSDPKHLRRQQEQRDHEAIADRIISQL